MGKLTGTQHGDAANARFAFYADKAIRRTNWKKRANALWPRLPWLSGLSAPIDTPSHVRNDGKKPKHVAKDVVDRIRKFRNLIHPAATLRQGFDPRSFTKEDLAEFKEMYESVTHSLLYYI